MYKVKLINLIRIRKSIAFYNFVELSLILI